MSNLPEPIDPRAMRAADADRERVADVLREAVAQGRISFDELDERLDQAYSAKTYAELEAITRDLPASGAVTAAAAPPAGYDGRPHRGHAGRRRTRSRS